MRVPIPSRTRPSRTLLAAATVAVLGALCAARAFAQAPDVSGWQALLDQYLIRLGDGRREPASTRFDYEQLYVDEHIWSQKRSERLEKLHAQIFAAAPSAMDAKARLAWAIDAYNFLVVERATMLLLVPRRQFQRYNSVTEMTSPDGQFFDALVARVEGRDYSMAEFERRFVYGDTTPMLEPRRGADPRLMFALCRGSVGGPPLAPRAFRPESLEVQLDQAVRTALATPGMAGPDPSGRKLLVSEYLGDRMMDFGNTQAGIVAFLEKHGPAPIRSLIKREKLTGVVRFTRADPTLNQFLRPKPAPPTATPQSKS